MELQVKPYRSVKSWGDYIALFHCDDQRNIINLYLSRHEVKFFNWESWTLQSIARESFHFWRDIFELFRWKEVVVGRFYLVWNKQKVIVRVFDYILDPWLHLSGKESEESRISHLGHF